MLVLRMTLWVACAATAVAQQSPETPRRAWKLEGNLKLQSRGPWRVDALDRSHAKWRQDESGLDEPSWNGQATPEDSVYREARELLNRGEYRRASELFRGFEQKYPKSRYVAAAMYWQAFSLYRVGATADLKQALRVLDDQRTRFPDATQEGEVASLTTRVVGALAARGDADATARLRDRATQAPSCDREDMEIRAEALTALAQSDPASAAPVLRRTLARRDECSIPLRRRAVYLLGREGVGGTAEDLLAVAKDDPDPSVRSDALARLAQMPGDAPVKMLEQMLTPAADERTQRALVQALRRSSSEDALRVLRSAITREDLSDDARADAIRSLGRRSFELHGSAPLETLWYIDGKQLTLPPSVPGEVHEIHILRPPPGGQTVLTDADVAMLRGVYEKTSARTVKVAILETIGGSENASGEQWLMSVVRNPNEDTRYRAAAMARLRRSDVSLDELGKLYDALSERELRAEVIRILGQREEPAATDKLIDIAKTGTDPMLRRAAISALARKNDPRTTKLLLDLVEKGS